MSAARASSTLPSVFGWITAFLLGAVVLVLGVNVLLLLFGACLVALVLRGGADLISARTRLSAPWALALLIVVGLAAIVLTGWAIAPALNDQVDRLGAAIPRALAVWDDRLRAYGWGRWLLDGGAGSLAPESLLDEVGSAIGWTTNAFFMIVIGVYLAAEPRSYAEGVLALIPDRHRPRGREVLDALALNLRGWLFGQLVAMGALGLASFIGLLLLDVPLALVLGLIMGALTFVPYLGPIVAIVPPVVVAAGESLSLAAYVLILYVVLQNIEGSVLTPLVQRRVVALPPALLFAVQLLLMTIVGTLGLILAAPLTVAGLVLVRMLYLGQGVDEFGRGLSKNGVREAAA